MLRTWSGPRTVCGYVIDMIYLVMWRVYAVFCVHAYSLATALPIPPLSLHGIRWDGVSTRPRALQPPHTKCCEIYPNPVK